MSKSFYQVIVGGEPLSWNGDGECFWRERDRVCDVVSDIQTYINPREIRIWHVETSDVFGPYTKPTVTDVTMEIAEAIADARMAVDAHCIEPDTMAESFFGSFAAFHADDYCDGLLSETQGELADVAGRSMRELVA